MDFNATLEKYVSLINKFRVKIFGEKPKQNILRKLLRLCRNNRKDRETWILSLFLSFLNSLLSKREKMISEMYFFKIMFGIFWLES